MKNIDFFKIQEKTELFYNSEKTDYEFYLYHLRDLGIENIYQDLKEESRFMLYFQNGLVQDPKQFACLLSLLENQNCESYCEIGIYVGFSFMLILSVLARKNKNIEAVTIDPYEEPHPEFYKILNNMGVSLTHIKDTSDSISGQYFDIVFIDGDHSYEWVKKDWENVGQHSKICIFHDITKTDTNVDVPKLYNSISGLKTNIETHEGVMGIGVVFPNASIIKNQ